MVINPIPVNKPLMNEDVRTLFRQRDKNYWRQPKENWNPKANRIRSNGFSGIDLHKTE